MSNSQKNNQKPSHQNFASVPNIPGQRIYEASLSSVYGERLGVSQQSLSTAIPAAGFLSETQEHQLNIQEDGNGEDLDAPNSPSSNIVESGTIDEICVIGNRVAGSSSGDISISAEPGCITACHPGTRNVTDRITYPQRIVAGSGHILNDLCASMWFSYLLIYLQEVRGFSSTTAAALMFLGQIVDGLSTPLIGYEADRANHFWLCRNGYGRCKSWHLLGVILVMISFPFVFSPCFGCENSDEWAKAIYYAPFIAIFQIGWASSQISHLALIPKLNHDVLIRTEMLAIRYGFTVASNITIFILTWITLGFKDTNCKISKSQSDTFMYLGLTAVGIGGVFSLLFHIFVIEKSDEEVKKTVSLIEANENTEESGDRNRELLNSLTTVTNVRSMASSMAISKVQTQARRRRNSISVSKADGDAGQSLLGDQDDFDGTSVNNTEQSFIPNRMATTNRPQLQSGSAVVIKGGCRLSTKSLNLGKENMSLGDWLTLPQFYIVALMYMSTRLSVNMTQVYMPLYLQKTLNMSCGSVAYIPLTMYCSGFVVAMFIKLINKYFGRQLAYAFGALMCVIGSFLVLYLDTTYLVNQGIYAVAVLLGGGASAILVTSLSITADMIGNNVENGAFVYGAMSFCDKLSCGLVVMMINSLAPDCLDPDNCNANESFYQNVLGYSCGGCSIVGVFGVIGLTFIIYLQNKRRDAELIAGLD